MNGSGIMGTTPPLFLVVFLAVLALLILAILGWFFGLPIVREIYKLITLKAPTDSEIRDLRASVAREIMQGAPNDSWDVVRSIVEAKIEEKLKAIGTIETKAAAQIGFSLTLFGAVTFFGEHEIGRMWSDPKWGLALVLLAVTLLLNLWVLMPRSKVSPDIYRYVSDEWIARGVKTTAIKADYVARRIVYAKRLAILVERIAYMLKWGFYVLIIAFIALMYASLSPSPDRHAKTDCRIVDSSLKCDTQMP